MIIDLEPLLSAVHAAMRSTTGVQLVGDFFERPALLGRYPPLDPVRIRRLNRIRAAGVLFVHIPKNAGMSVMSILYREQMFHPTIRYYRRVAPDIARLPSFAVWRDPVERFASAYRFARNGGSSQARVSRAFRDRYMQLRSYDEALDHVEHSTSLYDVDHIFRPQFWYVADASGRLAVDQLCMIEDLDQAVAATKLPGLERIGRLNPSEPIDFMPNDTQLRRLRRLYPIDFAMYDALRAGTLACSGTSLQAAR